MRIHPLIITALLTAGAAASGIVIYNHTLWGEASHAQEQLVANIRELRVTLRDAATDQSIDSMESILAVTNRSSASFDRIISVSKNSVLTGALGHTAFTNIALDDGTLEKVYALFESSKKEATIRSLFSKGTRAIEAYDVDDDLRGITSATDSQELTRRMYLAKGGLLNAQSIVRQAGLLGNYTALFATLSEYIGDVLLTVDSIVQASELHSYARADALLTQYRNQMHRLQDTVAHDARQLREDALFTSLADDADRLLPLLVEFEQ